MKTRVMVGVCLAGLLAAAAPVRNRLRGNSNSPASPPHVLNAKTDFNAVGDNRADDTTAITKWIAAVIASGKTGFLPAGTYKCTSQVVFLLNGAARIRGCSFAGDGVGRSILNVAAVRASPQALITCTSKPGDKRSMNIQAAPSRVRRAPTLAIQLPNLGQSRAWRPSHGPTPLHLISIIST